MESVRPIKKLIIYIAKPVKAQSHWEAVPWDIEKFVIFG